jgi:putative Mn2+ efflux pump MntP
MTFTGWLAGRTIVDLISEYDHWLAFSLLALVGGKMIWESLQRDSRYRKWDVTKGFPLLLLSLATSIDALAVGLSLAFVEVNIASAASTIGIVALIVTATGLSLGKKVGSIIGSKAEMVGGIILIGIGLRILLEHIL